MGNIITCARLISNIELFNQATEYPEGHEGTVHDIDDCSIETEECFMTRIKEVKDN